jgi:hypothetical protein
MPGLLSGLRKSSDGGGLNVQLPAAPDLEEACFNASLWIEMVNRQFRLRRYEPSVLIDAKVNSVPRRVFLKFGPIEPGDYIDIMGVEAETSLVRPARTSGADSAPDTDSEEALTYAQLLETRFGHG